MPNLEQIKQLRNETGVSLNECRKAIEEAKDDLNLAKEILKKKGQDVAAKKSGRDAGQGTITSYIHDNQKIGVLLDLRCESDFVARSDDFQNLSKEICLQIAAMGPLFIKQEDVPQDFIEKEKEIILEQLLDSGKPKEVVSKIVEGKINSYIKESCLVSQPWIKDSSRTINDLIQENIAKIGENILVKRFTRYEL
jgi:elongation factor Ts